MEKRQPDKKFPQQGRDKGEYSLGEERGAKSDNRAHPGERCPQCKQADLDYDGVLNLACPVCGYTFGGCFT